MTEDLELIDEMREFQSDSVGKCYNKRRTAIWHIMQVLLHERDYDGYEKALGQALMLMYNTGFKDASVLFGSDAVKYKEPISGH